MTSDPNVSFEPGPPDLYVVVENHVPAVNVVVEPPPPDIIVEVAEVGLAGRPGNDGQPGPPGLPGQPGRDGAPGQDGQDATGAVQEHIEAANPHPVYDDGPSFLLAYQNAKV